MRIRGAIVTAGAALLVATAQGAGQGAPVVVSSSDTTLRSAADAHLIVMRTITPPRRRGGGLRTLTPGGFAYDLGSSGRTNATLRARGTRVPITITSARSAAGGTALILKTERLRRAQLDALESSPRAAASSTTSGSLRGKDGPNAIVVGQADLRVDADALAANDGPPAMLVTFHGGSGAGAQNNVWALDADGDVVTDTFLLPSRSVTLDELRDLALAADGSLFVANANEDRNEVLRFAPPPDGGAPWQMVGTAPYAQGLTAANPGLAHPYGLALSPDEQILYASSQDTSVVTRLGGPAADGPLQGVPGAVGSAWTPLGNLLAGTLVPGSIAPSVKLPVPKPSTVAQADGGLRAPRGVALSPDGGTLYAADDSSAGGVRRYAADTGAFLGYAIDPATADRPIGVTTDSSGRVWASSKGADAIQTFDPSTGAVATAITETQFAAAGVTLDHPAGIEVTGEGPERVVLIANLAAQQIVCADLALGTAAVIADDLPDQPEQIELLPGSPGACLPST